MKRAERDRTLLTEVLLEAKAAGMKTFISNNKNYCYGYIITKSDHVLSLEKCDFSGFNFLLNYVQTKKNGAACCCNQEPLLNITVDTINEMEKAGLAFARELGANLYKNSEQFFKDTLCMTRIEEV